LTIGLTVANLFIVTPQTVELEVGDYRFLTFNYFFLAFNYLSSVSFLVKVF